METLFRHWSRTDCDTSTLLVTHGLTMRLFCMRWFHWSVEYFESLNNPGNAETRTLVRHGNRYLLDTAFDQWTPADPGKTVLDVPEHIW